jgi:hypothetical protein
MLGPSKKRNHGLPTKVLHFISASFTPLNVPMDSTTRLEPAEHNHSLCLSYVSRLSEDDKGWLSVNRTDHPSNSASGGPISNSATGEPMPRSLGLKGIRNTGADDGLQSSSNASRSVTHISIRNVDIEYEREKYLPGHKTRNRSL